MKISQRSRFCVSWFTDDFYSGVCKVTGGAFQQPGFRVSIVALSENPCRDTVANLSLENYGARVIWEDP
jgi:hypothetical protein